MNWLFRYIYNIQRSESRAGPRVLGIALLAFCLLYSPLTFIWSAPSRWSAFKEPVTAQSSGATCDKLHGGHYHISVNGQHIACHGADTTCALGTEPVVYERNDPERCRVAKNVGRPSHFELFTIGYLAMTVSLALGLLTIRESDRGLRRLITHAPFYIFMILNIAVSAWFIGVDEPTTRQWPTPGTSQHPEAHDTSRTPTAPPEPRPSDH